ncbi:MAG: hypothetical protein KatS3mg002_1754 [Candidatus Woesearchaeota archaeon]|nr:MAG: hypothetical protein KatS3mg002_1754 [Candidatus Woesearchaeota archaeon]
MKIKKNIIIFISFLFIGCQTDVNIYTDVINPRSNTNPLKAQGFIPYLGYGWARGGWLFLKRSFPGQTGNAQAIKRGVSCQRSILWLVSIGDSSIETAKKNGNITKIASVDYEILDVLSIIYHRVCTIVQGE